MAEDILNEKASDYVEEMYQSVIEDWGSLTSFADVEDKVSQVDYYEDLSYVVSVYNRLASNINYSSEITDKISAWKKLTKEFVGVVNGVLDGNYGDMEDKEKTVFQDVVDKIKSLIKAKRSKTEGGTSYSASDYAYVPDPQKPSTWKLRMAEGSSGNFTKAQLGRAAAAFSSGGFRGNKVQLPSGSVSSAKSKIRSKYRSLGVKDEEIPDSLKESNGSLMIFKDKESDSLRWLTTYSNCYRDDDDPAEIISKESHKNFVNLVDSGMFPAPELWHWHVPGSKYGTGDFVAWDEENGMALAGGTIDPGHEKEAMIIASQPNIAVSHGMPPTHVRYDASDPTVIIEHITKEVSDLPDWAAANKLTGFYVFEEDKIMGIPDTKKEYLRKAGLTDEQIAQIELGNSAKAKEAEQMGLESKEKTEPVAEVTPPEVKETKVETPTEEKTKEEAIDQPFLTKEEFTATTKEVLSPIVTSITALAEQISALSERMVAMETSEKAKEISHLPVASLAALITKDMNLSVIGSNEARVTKRENLSGAGPLETKEADPSPVSTGNAVVDKIIGSVLAK